MSESPPYKSIWIRGDTYVFYEKQPLLNRDKEPPYFEYVPKSKEQDALKHVRAVIKRYDAGEHTTGADFILACRAEIEQAEGVGK